jgi:alanyl-tRNA synthetase
VEATISYKRLGDPQKHLAGNLNLGDLTQGLAKSELLYLREMHLATAEATALRVVPEKKSHAYLILDKTLFHPKGGGQPSDRGTLSSTQFELELKKAIYYQGIVVHWCKILKGTPLAGPVTCQLDWPYRYLVMRRHTGAHLIDHCLAEATSSRVETTDSWLDEPCYVGYKGTTPDPSALTHAQDIARKMISAGAPVKIHYLSPEQGRQVLKNAPNFERLPDLQEIRIVTIEGCDPIPCGGTHVSNIKEIGGLSILSAEQMPDLAFRVHFSVEA